MCVCINILRTGHHFYALHAHVHSLKFLTSWESLDLNYFRIMRRSHGHHTPEEHSGSGCTISWKTLESFPSPLFVLFVLREYFHFIQTLLDIKFFLWIIHLPISLVYFAGRVVCVALKLKLKYFLSHSNFHNNFSWHISKSLRSGNIRRAVWKRVCWQAANLETKRDYELELKLIYFMCAGVGRHGTRVIHRFRKSVRLRMRRRRRRNRGGKMKKRKRSFWVVFGLENKRMLCRRQAYTNWFLSSSPFSSSVLFCLFFEFIKTTIHPAFFPTPNMLILALKAPPCPVSGSLRLTQVSSLA